MTAIIENAPLDNKDSIIRKLRNKKLLVQKENEPFEISVKLSNKNFIGMGIGDCVCEWCKVSTITTHSHHFPIERQFGGKETVNICANCHQEYHSLSGKLSYSVAPELQIYFNIQ